MKSIFLSVLLSSTFAFAAPQKNSLSCQALLSTLGLSNNSTLQFVTDKGLSLDREYGMDSKIEMNLSFPELRFTSVDLVVGASEGQKDEDISTWRQALVEPMAERPRARFQEFSQSEVDGQSLTSTIPWSTYLKLKDTLAKIAASEGFEFHFSGLDAFYYAAGPIKVFKGPFPGTAIVTTSDQDPDWMAKKGWEKSRYQATAHFVKFYKNVDIFRGNVGVYPYHLPKGFSVENIFYSKDRIYFEDGKLNSHLAYYSYLEDGHDNFLNRWDVRKRNLSEITSDRLAQWSPNATTRFMRAFNPVEEIAVFTDDKSIFDLFTGEKLVHLDGMTFGAINVGGQSYLRVLDKETREILFEKPLDRTLATESKTDIYTNHFQKEYGVDAVIPAYKFDAYRNAGIRYIVLLSDGSVWTIKDN